MKKLIEQNNKTITEVILMALTYRLSYVNLAKLFKTTVEDVSEAFSRFSEYDEALKHLRIETECEDETDSRVAFVNAYNYWATRKIILRELAKAVKENNADQEREAREKLKNHRLKIDDSLAMAIMDRTSDLSINEQKEVILKYRLKYGISIKQIVKLFHHDRRIIKRWEEEYCQINPIYKGKIEILNGYYDKVKMNLDFNEVNANIKRG
jgi:hypothetical protein